MTKAEITSKIEAIKKNSAIPEKQKAQLLAVYEKKLAEMKEEPKEEPKKKEEAKPKAEPKTESKPEAKTESKGASKPKRDDDEDLDCEELEEREVKAKKYGYDLDELLTKAKEGKAKAKKRAQERANEPKKTPATRNKEAVAKTTDRVTTNVEGRAKKGSVDAREIEKLIAEYEEAIAKLKKILAGLKGGKKMVRGGGVDARKKPKMVRSIFEEEEFEYRRGGYTTPRTTGSDPKRDKMYQAMPSGHRKSHRISEIEKKDGTSFMRRNANQYVDSKHSGNREYYESARNRTDKGKFY